MQPTSSERAYRHSSLEVLLAFLKLGLTSFGGPIAHIGYFRAELVVKRRWLDDAAYTDLVALCQFLPGPSSSQLGFSLGLLRAGYRGALAAWTGFTLPSATLMTAFAFGAASLGGAMGTGLLHGLELVAVAIVAQAVWQMGRTMCPDLPRAAIAALVAVWMLGSASAASQVGALVLGAALGYWLCRDPSANTTGVLHCPVSRRVAVAALGTFFFLLAMLPMLRAAYSVPGLALFDAFYRSGALVFGGGHVVLPLLRDAVVSPGWVSERTFLAGYGAAQAMPGPLFTFAAYLGAVTTTTPHGFAGAAIALVGIFLPGMLVLIGTLPPWAGFRSSVGAQAITRGINAAVVGLLAAALYSPLWTRSVLTAADMIVAIIGFLLLTVWSTPPVVVVIGGAIAGVSLSIFAG